MSCYEVADPLYAKEDYVITRGDFPRHEAVYASYLGRYNRKMMKINFVAMSKRVQLTMLILMEWRASKREVPSDDWCNESVDGEDFGY